MVMTKKRARDKRSKGAHVALLRGINVGGKNKLPMKSLAEIFAEAGCEAAQTYIQSGNVVYRAKADVARQIPVTIAKIIADRHGLTVPVITRRADALCTIRDSNPFIAAGEDQAKLHVAFLADKPSKAMVAALDPDRSPPDQFILSGSEIFLFCPNGLARTKLTNAYFDSKLRTTSTVRNWKSVLKLCELAGSL